MSTTKPDTETGWSKEWPKIDGVYWTRFSADDPDCIPVRLENYALYEFGVNGRFGEAEYAECEFLGPVSPSDFEQLIRLREIAKDPLRFRIEMNEVRQILAQGQSREEL